MPIPNEQIKSDVVRSSIAKIFLAIANQGDIKERTEEEKREDLLRSLAETTRSHLIEEQHCYIPKSVIFDSDKAEAEPIAPSFK